MDMLFLAFAAGVATAILVIMLIEFLLGTDSYEHSDF